MHEVLCILEENFKKKAAEIVEKKSAGILSCDDLLAFNVLGEAIHHAECHQLKQSKYHESPIGDDSAESGERQEYQNIREEIEGAKKYYKAWLETGEEVYEKLALEEVGHAEALIGLLRNTATAKDVKFINEGVATINAIKVKLVKTAK